MNLQTVEDLIEELQRLPAHVRKLPVHIKTTEGSRHDHTIRVVHEGPEVCLKQLA